MDIRIKAKTRNFRVAYDGRQFTLQEVKILGEESKKPGEEYFIDLGYYAKLEVLIERMVMMDLADQDITTLKELLEKLKNMRAWLTELIIGEV